MRLPVLVTRYAAFAALATASNVSIQHVSMWLYGRPPLALPLAMAAGTLVGLVVKYVLDKRWIFYDLSTGAAMHSRKFGLYTTMGVLTTGIFWGTELAFHAAFGTQAMRDVGAVLGLSTGYIVKYLLDRRFVFRSEGRP